MDFVDHVTSTYHLSMLFWQRVLGDDPRIGG